MVLTGLVFAGAQVLHLLLHPIWAISIHKKYLLFIFSLFFHARPAPTSSPSAGCHSARTGIRPHSVSTVQKSICIKEACLSVCLSVCLFDRISNPNYYMDLKPNLAWDSPWTMWVKSKCFFGLTPQGGYNFGKTQKIQTSPIWSRREGGGNPFAAPFAQLKEHSNLFFLCVLRGNLDTFKWVERSEASQRVGPQRVRSRPHPGSI